MCRVGYALKIKVSGMLDQLEEKPRSKQAVSVTLELDVEIYDFFSKKAKKLGYEVEPYIAQTLGIVTGCRAFSESDLCSPKTVEAKRVG